VNPHRPLLVFVSHTGEFATFPRNGSFLAAAKEAVIDSGHLPVEMSSFVAGSAPTALACEDAVRKSDVYLGILGHRYGTLLPDRDISYTELEYECAVLNEIPQIMFLLSLTAPVPPDTFYDSGSGYRQEQFRAMAQGAGKIILEFDSPEDLKYKVHRSLNEEARLIDSARNPARPSRDQLRSALDERVPEAAWCSEYLAALALGEKSEVPVASNDSVIFVAVEVAHELAQGGEARRLLTDWPRLQTLISGHADKNALLSCVTKHHDTFAGMSEYLAAQRRADPSIAERIDAPGRSSNAEIATAYHRPHARALIDLLWNDGDWPELERQAARWADAKDPSLRMRARNALLAALEARGPAYAERAARTAAGFADAPDAECVDLVMAATYAAVAGDPDAARRYVREARGRWPDDRDARRLEARLGL
jgi:hypothetical protein